MRAHISPDYPDWYPYNLTLAYAWTGAKAGEAIDIAEAYVRHLPTDPYGYTNLANRTGVLAHLDQAAAAGQRHAAAAAGQVARAQPD